MSDLILFWHRRDLRLTDNLGLAAARERSPKVVGVFCLDPQLLVADVAPARVNYLIGSLRELQQRYQEAGSQLLILRADPRRALPQLAATLPTKAVFWNLDVEPYARERDQAVQQALRERGIELQNFWDQLLHDPESIRTGSGQVYTVFSPFWRNWLSRPKPQPVPVFADAQGLTEAEQLQAQQAGAIPLPTAAELGFVWERQLVIEPGETTAQERLDQFCRRAITAYRDQRNFPAAPGTSQLSAALKFGVLSPRTAWAATVTAAQHSRSDEAGEGIQTWRQELAWREFYQHVLYHFPELAVGAFRETFKAFPWGNNEAYFQAWCAGQTGYPIVDAAMRQLNEMGWMHNRCRMIVASFLVKDLLVDTRWGEKYFMQKLMDGDLSANNGGWQWSASSGMDPKPIRIFNPASQAQKFDPDAAYIREWLPELRRVDTEHLLSGKIPAEERQRAGYPAPIVDHNQQQRRFKQLYQQQKEGQLGLNL